MALVTILGRSIPFITHLQKPKEPLLTIFHMQLLSMIEHFIYFGLSLRCPESFTSVAGKLPAECIDDSNSVGA